MRRPRKILADEREILREQRIAGFAAAEDQRFSSDGDVVMAGLFDKGTKI